MISLAKSNYSSFKDEHVSAIVNFCNAKGRWVKYRKSTLDDEVEHYFSPIAKNLSELLSATPDKLMELKEHYENKSAFVKGQIRRKIKLVGLYNNFIDKKTHYLTGNNKVYNSDYLSQKIDIKTCPYCNENSTYSFEYKATNIYRRTFDWDHILPKDKYPFLAISFFNLVPACKVCNQLKLNEIFEISPHQDFNPDKTYSFFIKGHTLGFLSDSSTVTLFLKIRKSGSGKAMKFVIEKVGLDARMTTQTDLVRDILNKKILFRSSYWSALERFVSKNSKSQVDLTKFFFSAYFNHSEYYKRINSKLTSDLLKP